MAVIPSKLFGNMAEPQVAKLDGRKVIILPGNGERKKTLRFKSYRKARHFYESLQRI
jgi:hypothetical protein